MILLTTRISMATSMGKIMTEKLETIEALSSAIWSVEAAADVTTRNEETCCCIG
jgi:hypothetical protein